MYNHENEEMYVILYLNFLIICEIKIVFTKQYNCFFFFFCNFVEEVCVKSSYIIM